MKTRQLSFQKTHWKYQFSHGGKLRCSRRGRGFRALSLKEPLHLVLKANKERIRNGFRTYKRFFLIDRLMKKYAFKFYIKVEQISVQGDHIHLLIRTTKRSNYQSFFRVFAGQIAQQFEKEGLLSVPTPVTDTPKSQQNQGRKAKVTDTPKTRSKGLKLERELGVEVGLRDEDTAEGEIKGTRLLAKLWKYRPFTRVVRGYRAYKIARDYIQLNEKEALGEIPYRKQRLKGLSAYEWEILWG